MLPTAPLNIADLGTDRLQVSDSSTNLVSSTTPEATFASLLAPLPEPDVGLVPPAIGQALPVEGESLPEPTSLLPFVEDGASATLPAATAPEIDARHDAPYLLAEAVDGDEVTVVPVSQTDQRRRVDVRTDRTGTPEIGISGERTVIPGGTERSPRDQSVIRPDAIRLNVGNETADAEIPAQASLARSAAVPVQAAEEAATNRRPEADLLPLRAGPERTPIDVTRDAVLTPDAPIGRDAAETSSKPAMTVSGNVIAGATEPALLREAGAAPKGTQTVMTTIDRPVQDDAWGESLQDRVLWMTSRKIQSAEIRLNPAELGPIRVQVSVQDDAAVLNFTAQHSVTRDAIEQAMPRLREMLNENGLTLAGTTVSDSREERAGDDKYAATGAEPRDKDIPHGDESDLDRTEVRRRDVSGLVDTFV